MKTLTVALSLIALVLGTAARADANATTTNVSLAGQDSVEPGTYHPPSVLADDGMRMLIGRVDGQAVAAAMGYVTDDAIGVFGVTTVASARRRGYGTAVTRAAMLTETCLPVILAPSREGERLYERLGFEHVGGLSIWVKGGQAR